MTSEQIILRLRAHGVPVGELIPLRGGRVAEHVYRFARPDAGLQVIKAVRPNESLILRVLAHQKSPLVPAFRCEALLGEDLLLWDYIEPAPPRPLHRDTATAYADFHNATDDGTVFARLGLPANLNKSEHGFYSASFRRCDSEASANLQKLAGRDWPVLDAMRSAAMMVHDREDELAERFDHTPFAWVHHDFRDENLVGYPQKLIDWGSSYGYGPYLYDIAPYLLESSPAMEAFAQSSAIWRTRTPREQREDLIASAAAALMGYLHWHVGDLLGDGDFAALRASMERRAGQFATLVSWMSR